jgi:hypothetical protein
VSASFFGLYCSMSNSVPVNHTRQLAAGSEAAGSIPFSQSGLQLTLLNLLPDPSQRGRAQQRVLHLTVPAHSAGAAITFVKLLRGPALAPRLRGFEEGHAGEDDLAAFTVAHVVAGLADGRTFIWAVTPDSSCAAAGGGVSSSLLPYAAVVEGQAGSRVVSVSAAVAVTAVGSVPVHAIVSCRHDQ